MSFWADYRKQYGEDALPPAGRKALGLTARGDLAVDPRPVIVRLNKRRREMLDRMADEVGMKPDGLARSLIEHVLEDDEAAGVVG